MGPLVNKSYLLRKSRVETPEKKSHRQRTLWSQTLGVIAFLALTLITTISPAADGEGLAATSPVKPEGNDLSLVRLEQRVKSYWQALVLRDYVTAYALEYATKMGDLDPDVFYDNARKKMRLMNFTILDIKIQDGVGVATISETRHIPFLKNLRTRQRRSYWLPVEEDWYHRTNITSEEKTNIEPED